MTMVAGIDGARQVSGGPVLFRQVTKLRKTFAGRLNRPAGCRDR